MNKLFIFVAVLASAIMFGVGSFAADLGLVVPDAGTKVVIVAGAKMCTTYNTQSQDWDSDYCISNPFGDTIAEVVDHPDGWGHAQAGALRVEFENGFTYWVMNGGYESP